MATPYNDPWESAEKAELRRPDYWGQVQLDMFYAVLEKGVGKVPFDPNVHSIDKRVTAIDILILPLPEQNVQYPVTRNMIAESKEWAGIILKSLKALNISPRGLNGQFARVKIVPTGATYTNKNQEVKEKTTFEFVKIFASEAECRADYLADGGQAAPAAEGAPWVDTTAQPAAQPVNGNGAATPDAGRATALQFLKVVVKNAVQGQTDLEVIRTTIATNISNMPMISKYYTVDSEETVQLLMTAMGQQA